MILPAYPPCMSSRVLVFLLGALLAGCGASADGNAPARPEPVAEVVEARPGDGEPAEEAATDEAAVGTTEAALGTGVYAADGTLCADPSAALHALMPEAFEAPGEDGDPELASPRD